MATTLMPVNPSAAQQQVARILPIRANLLPAEITAGRNARRMRVIVIAVVATVAVALGGWYYAAARDKAAADDENAQASEQITVAHKSMNSKDLAEVTTVTGKTDTLVRQLKTVTADDLPWSTLMTKIQAVATTPDSSVLAITSAISTTQTSGANLLPSATTAATVGSLSITGTAKDKNTIAALIEKLPSVAGVANPYLTTVTQSAAALSFTITADITSKVLCGRYSTPCGGK